MDQMLMEMTEKKEKENEKFVQKVSISLEIFKSRLEKCLMI